MAAFRIMILLILCLNCSPTIIQDDKQREITGTLVVIGNEPFTQYAIHESDTSIIPLKFSQDMEKLISSYQGSNIIAYGATFTPLNELIVDSINIQSTLKGKSLWFKK